MQALQLLAAVVIVAMLAGLKHLLSTHIAEDVLAIPSGVFVYILNRMAGKLVDKLLKALSALGRFKEADQARRLAAGSRGQPASKP